MEKTSTGIVMAEKPTKVKKVILVKELDDVLYALAVRTCTDMVYDRKYKYTLTELLDDIQEALTHTSCRLTKLKERFDILMKDCPEEANTLKKIWDYINVDARDEDGNPTSALIKLIESKVSKEPGKGLSTHDLTDILYDKLVNGYTKEELDEKFEVVLRDINNLKEVTDNLNTSAKVYISETAPESLQDGSLWFQIITRDGD
jgi:hypothetical protein